MESQNPPSSLPVLAERDRTILAAVINCHIATAEPISSQQLCATCGLGWSSATVRSAMARLEEWGFLFHPYTSSGKIPTVLAYRYFVERLMEEPRLTASDEREIHARILNQICATDHVMKLTARILAMVSQLLAVFWIPGQGPERLARIQLLRVAPRRLILVVRTGSRKEFKQTFDPGSPVTLHAVHCITQWVNERGQGLSGPEIERMAEIRWPGLDRSMAPLLQQALRLISSQLSLREGNDLVMEGAANLVRQPEFNDVGALRRMVDWLDRGDELLRVFEAPVIERRGVCVVIGDDGGSVELPPLSFVSEGVALQDGRHARLGVIGPRRMPYNRIISLVQGTALALAQAWVAE